MNKNFQLFEVGGSIRDSILGVPTKDRDFVVIGESFEQMKAIFIEMGGKIWMERPEFFTIRGKLPNVGDADFVLGRKEGIYSDGRHPDSVSVALTIEEELTRRDFTINAIAKNAETGEIIDPFNGANDIRLRMIRAVGDPKKRLDEDKLRAFRALRFSITKGFMIEPGLGLCIQSLSPSDFHSVSNERIKDELEKMFLHDPITAMIVITKFHFLATLAFRERGISLFPSLKKK